MELQTKGCFISLERKIYASPNAIEHYFKKGIIGNISNFFTTSVIFGRKNALQMVHRKRCWWIEHVAGANAELPPPT